MADLSREIQRADELVIAGERRRSMTLTKLDAVRETEGREYAGKHGADADARLAKTLAVVEFADRAARTPGLRDVVARDLERVQEATRSRELPEVPVSSDRNLSGERTGAVIAAAQAATDQAAQSRRESDRATAEALLAEVERRRVEMLRGTRPSEEFRPEARDAKEGARIVAGVREAGRQNTGAREQRTADHERD